MRRFGDEVSTGSVSDRVMAQSGTEPIVRFCVATSGGQPGRYRSRY